MLWIFRKEAIIIIFSETKNDKTVYAEHRREITVLVNEIFHESNEIFGAKKIAAIIKEKGYIASPELVRSIMKENG